MPTGIGKPSGCSHEPSLIFTPRAHTTQSWFPGLTLPTDLLRGLHIFILVLPPFSRAPGTQRTVNKGLLDECIGNNSEKSKEVSQIPKHQVNQAICSRIFFLSGHPGSPAPVAVRKGSFMTIHLLLPQASSFSGILLNATSSESVSDHLI